MNDVGEMTKLGFAFLNHELYWSSLLIAQSTLPNSSIPDYFLILKSLLHLGFHKEIQRIVELNTDLLKIQEIKLLYVRSGKESSVQPITNVQVPTFDTLDSTSVELLFTALSKKELLRKQQFVLSFERDSRNIEPLIYLYKESLCNFKEMAALIDKIPNTHLRSIMSALISGDVSIDNIVCPLVICSLAYKTLFEREMMSGSALLFRVCVRNLDLFGDCEFIYLGMGMYYLAKEKYKEALSCFYKAIEINKNLGPGHLLAGICHSKLKETEYAVKVLNNAYSIMSSSYIPAYCLAYEYQLMNNIPKAKHYFKRSISLMEDSLAINEVPKNKKHRSIRQETSSIDNIYGKPTDYRVIYSFIYCLIYNEEYEEAMRYLELFSIKNILKVFCLLFTGKLEEARASLEECEKNSYYFVCKGFICHLIDDLENAIQNYEKSLAFGANSVIESLLNMAYENKVNSRPNRAFDYSNCLFESFGFKKRIF
ncbi:uncharacterized protein VICG_01735 [Vittaforma corneae ATCC 50505]|uniref:Uncharacterized protein n=1 Tax=Vittaforma corneae (strain ATCC 50505) TaxID=993615 RepID=L2GK73_VITCO|nr:uncharacterized protein VICG_01735 [Vittaforma corneae ATCC 50505]ELA41246.1 hypothetical protein VICG_01735 [Vittaforma corneae ATCC 50505]